MVVGINGPAQQNRVLYKSLRALKRSRAGVSRKMDLAKKGIPQVEAMLKDGFLFELRS